MTAGARELIVEPTLQLVTLGDFVVRPEAGPTLVADIVPREAIIVAFGPPKGGKTFAVVDLVMHAAHNMEWHGHAPVGPLKVAFLAGEGRNGLKIRLKAWLEHHDTAQLTGDFRLLPEAIALPSRASELVDALEAYRPDIIVVDTLNAYFGQGDENSTLDMTAFVAAVRHLRDSLKASVIVIHHTGLADATRERGSGVLRGAADVIVQIARDESGSGLVGFQVVTGRDLEGWSEPLSLRLRRVEVDWKDDQGEPLTTCVLEGSEAPVSLAGRGRGLGEAQTKLLTVMREIARSRPIDQAGWVLLTRLEVTEVAKQQGLAKQSISSAWKPLQARGLIHLLEPGSVRVKVAASGPRPESPNWRAGERA